MQKTLGFFFSRQLGLLGAGVIGGDEDIHCQLGAVRGSIILTGQTKSR